MSIVPSISISAPSSAPVGQSFTVSGYVREDGQGIYGVTVRILVDGSFVTSTTTNASGYYSRSIYISEIGYHTLTAEAPTLGISASRGITITYTPVASSISVNAPSGANINVSFTISGYVYDQYGNPYYSGPVTITVAGQTHTVYANSSSGYYSKSTSIATAGTYTIRASAGSVSDTDSIQIVDPSPPPPPPPPPDPTPTIMTLVSSKTTVTPGESFTLTATLKTEGGTPLAGRSIAFKQDGVLFYTGTTNSSGVVTRNHSIASAGSYVIEASYAGE